MAKVLRYKQLNERSRELVDGIQTERRAKKVSGGLGGGWSAAAVPLAFHVPVAGAIFGAGALVMGGYYKLFSAISRKNTNELAKELLKNGHAKKNDIILVNKSNVHIIKPEGYQRALAKAQQTFLKHLIPARYRTFAKK